MKIIDIKPITETPDIELNDDTIDQIIERPLIEPINILRSKGIKTISSSCNKTNASCIADSGRNTYIDSNSGRNTLDYGLGYAYIMFDFDSLSPDNKDTFQTLYGVLNSEVNEINVHKKTYNDKRMIYAWSPRSSMLTATMPRITPQMTSIFERRTNNQVFTSNYDMINAIHIPERVVLLRYPVDKNTEDIEVTAYFSKVANLLISQQPPKIEFNINSRSK